MSDWTLRHALDQEWKGTAGSREKYRETQWTHPIRYAGHGHFSEKGAKVKIRRNFNGSGSSAFGGAKNWLVVDAHIPLPADCEELPALLAARLRDAVASFIHEYGLDPRAKSEQEENDEV